MPKIETKVKKKKNNNITFILLFAITFVMTLFLVSAMFKNFSPPVDVNIGGEEVAEETPTEEFPERDIDDRLKWIQFEDNITESPVVNEVQKTPQQETKTKKVKNIHIGEQIYNNKKEEPQQKEEPVMAQNKYIMEPPVPVNYKPVQPPVPTISEIKTVQKTVKNPETSTPSVKMTKVYVGYYPTREEADRIKNQIAASFGGYQPYVKQSGSQYIVQIGSFSDRSKAFSLKTELANKGFPARLLTE